MGSKMMRDSAGGVAVRYARRCSQGATHISPQCGLKGGSHQGQRLRGGVVLGVVFRRKLHVSRV
jgi:hypothetical protein